MWNWVLVVRGTITDEMTYLLLLCCRFKSFALARRVRTWSPCMRKMNANDCVQTWPSHAISLLTLTQKSVTLNMSFLRSCWCLLTYWTVSGVLIMSAAFVACLYHNLYNRFFLSSLTLHKYSSVYVSFVINIWLYMVLDLVLAYGESCHYFSFIYKLHTFSCCMTDLNWYSNCVVLLMCLIRRSCWNGKIMFIYIAGSSADVNGRLWNFTLW